MAETGKTIEFDLDKDIKPDFLGKSIKKQYAQIGKEPFIIRLLSTRKLNSSVYAALLLLINDYLFSFFKSGNKKTEISLRNTIHDEYIKQLDIKQLELEIENMYKVIIEFEKKKPMDEVFGIWKNEDISLEKIRKKAWRRNK